MRNLFPTLFIGLLAIVMSGCSPSAKTKSEQDISRGDTKLSDADEMQKIEDATDGDYNKMTQVDPKLEQEAMAAFDKAIQDDPSNPDAYYARGFARLSHSDAIQRAVDDFTKAIELKPDYAGAYLMRGRACEALGDTEKAQADRAKALELQPGID